MMQQFLRKYHKSVFRDFPQVWYGSITLIY